MYISGCHAAFIGPICTQLAMSLCMLPDSTAVSADTIKNRAARGRNTVLCYADHQAHLVCMCSVTLKVSWALHGAMSARECERQSESQAD